MNATRPVELTSAAEWIRPHGALVVTPVHPVTGARGWTVVEGCRKHHTVIENGDERGTWHDLDRPIDLNAIARAILIGQLVPYPQNRYGGRPWWWVRADERRHAERIGTDMDTVIARRHRDTPKSRPSTT